MRYFLIPLFLSSRTQMNSRVSNIYSQAFTFMVDNSKTIDYIHRNINIHRALMFSGLQLIWSDDSWLRRRFSDLSNTIFTFFFLTQCLMTKQATDQTPISVNIWQAAAGFQQTLYLWPAVSSLALVSQAHLHVSKVEEVVHVSGGRVLVVGHENLWEIKQMLSLRTDGSGDKSRCVSAVPWSRWTLLWQWCCRLPRRRRHSAPER